MASWTYQPGTDPNRTNLGSIDQGYYVKLPDSDPADNHPSGYLQRDNGDRLDVWITQAQISAQMAGSFGQSVRMRQFFPRNFVAPIWTITGIVPNSFQLQRLGEFVRRTQFDALNPTGVSDLETNLVALHIYPGTLGILPRDKDTMNKLTPEQQRFLTDNPRAVLGKGPNANQYMRGYIQHFVRGAQKFVNVPTYELQFAVAFSYGSLFITQNWNEIYRKVQEPSAISYAQLGTGQNGPSASIPQVG